MKNNILLLDPNNRNPEAVKKIVEIIKNGGKVVLPWGAPQREAFVMVADATNLEAVRGLNALKGRPLDQTVGITTFPKAIPLLADLDNTLAVKKNADRLGLTTLDYITKLFEQGAVAIIVKASNELRLPLIKVNETGMRTVMFATEMNYHDNPIIHEIYEQLYKDGIVLGGTSANRQGETTYAIHQQEKAIEDMAPVVDLFVGYTKSKFNFKRLKMLPKFLQPLHFASSTYFDMTQDPAILLREGSVHPELFRKLIPNFKKTTAIKKEPLRQRRIHILTDRLMRRLVA